MASRPTSNKTTRPDKEKTLNDIAERKENLGNLLMNSRAINRTKAEARRKELH